MERTLGFAMLILVSGGLSFLMSGMEAGVFALSLLRIRQQMRAENRRAERLHSYLQNPEDFLWTIFIGNTLAGFAAISLIFVALHGWLAEHRVVFWTLFGLLVFFFYAFCDLLPKMLFRTFP